MLQCEKIFIKNSNFYIGLTNLIFNDVEIKIYDKERLLVELIRNKIKYDKIILGD